MDAQSSLRRRPMVRFAKVVMSGQAMLVAATLSLLLFNGGCSVIIADVGWRGDPSEIKVGSTRAAVQAKLGESIRSERTREGARIDTYEYKKRLPVSDSVASDVLMDVITVGVWELIATPGWIYTWYTKPLERSKIYYDPTDHVLWVSAPEPSPYEPRPATKSR